MGRIADTMQALVLQDYHKDYREHLTLETRPTPQPGPGEVLVKIAATPVNPSDLMFLQGLYGVKKALPAIPGFEGTGTVVKAGRGLLPRAWLGRRVLCITQNTEGGTWAEYTTAQASSCFPIGDTLSDEQAATAFVNPLTALALMEMAREKHARAVVSTAAASQVGRMILRIGQQRAVPVIHIVRRDEQVELLQGMGARYVLNSSAVGFESRLRDLSRQLRATVLFDAVAGSLAGQVLHAMPRNSTAVIYGSLSLNHVTLNPSQTIFQGKQVEGFWLAAPQRSLSPLGLLRVLQGGRGILRGDSLTHSDIRGHYLLSEAIEAICAYDERMSDGKVLIVPGR